MIANNAGVEGEVIVEALMGLSFEMGYNAMDDRCAGGHAPDNSSISNKCVISATLPVMWPT